MKKQRVEEKHPVTIDLTIESTSPLESRRREESNSTDETNSFPLLQSWTDHQYPTAGHLDNLSMQNPTQRNLTTAGMHSSTTLSTPTFATDYGQIPQPRKEKIRDYQQESMIIEDHVKLGQSTPHTTGLISKSASSLEGSLLGDSNSEHKTAPEIFSQPRPYANHQHITQKPDDNFSLPAPTPITISLLETDDSAKTDDDLSTTPTASGLTTQRIETCRAPLIQKTDDKNGEFVIFKGEVKFRLLSQTSDELECNKTVTRWGKKKELLKSQGKIAESDYLNYSTIDFPSEDVIDSLTTRRVVSIALKKALCLLFEKNPNSAVSLLRNRIGTIKDPEHPLTRPGHEVCISTPTITSKMFSRSNTHKSETIMMFMQLKKLLEKPENNSIAYSSPETSAWLIKKITEQPKHIIKLITEFSCREHISNNNFDSLSCIHTNDRILGIPSADSKRINSEENASTTLLKYLDNDIINARELKKLTSLHRHDDARRRIQKARLKVEFTRLNQSEDQSFTTTMSVRLARNNFHARTHHKKILERELNTKGGNLAPRDTWDNIKIPSILSVLYPSWGCDFTHFSIRNATNKTLISEKDAFSATENPKNKKQRTGNFLTFGRTAPKCETGSDLVMELLAESNKATQLDARKNKYNTFKQLPYIEVSSYRQIDQPKELSLNLYPNQLKAAQYMIDQEKMKGGINKHFWDKVPLPMPQEYRHYSQSADDSTLVQTKSCTIDTLWYCPIADIFTHTQPEESFGGILGLSMGEGKTATTLATIFSNKADNEWLQAKTEKPRSAATLIVCPPTLLTQWEDSIKTAAIQPKVYLHYNQQKKLRHKNREDILSNDYDIILTTYPVISNDIRTSLDIDFWRIVLDESHNYKPSSQTAFAVISLSGRNRWCLSGTPLESITSLITQMNFLKLGPLTHKTNLDYIAIHPERTRSLLSHLIFKLKTHNNIDEKEQQYAHQPPELPPLKYEIKTVPLKEDEALSYVAFKKNLKHEFDNISRDLGTFNSLRYSQLMTSLLEASSYTWFKSNDKQKCRLESKALQMAGYIKDILKDKNNKVIIFTNFSDTAYALKSLLDENDLSPKIIKATDAIQKGKIISALKKSDNSTVGIFTYSQAATGLNLQEFNRIIFFDPPKDKRQLEQAIKRLHRTGQKQEVTATFIIADNTIERAYYEDSICHAPFLSGKKQPANSCMETVFHYLNTTTASATSKPRTIAGSNHNSQHLITATQSTASTTSKARTIACSYKNQRSLTATQSTNTTSAPGNKKRTLVRLTTNDATEEITTSSTHTKTSHEDGIASTFKLKRGPRTLTIKIPSRTIPASTKRSASCLATSDTTEKTTASSSHTKSSATDNLIATKKKPKTLFATQSQDTASASVKPNYTQPIQSSLITTPQQQTKKQPKANEATNAKRQKILEIIALSNPQTSNTNSKPTGIDSPQNGNTASLKSSSNPSPTLYRDLIPKYPFNREKMNKSTEKKPSPSLSLTTSAWLPESTNKSPCLLATHTSEPKAPDETDSNDTDSDMEFGF